MTTNGPLLPEQKHIPDIKADTAVDANAQVLSTRDHEVIRRWAARRRAEPATGEATTSGPATVAVKDGGAGIRFNFPGTGLFRPISWDEWFANFDSHQLAFIFDNDSPSPASPSNRYRLVKADDWKDTIG
jgi:hypothetical protein